MHSVITYIQNIKKLLKLDITIRQAIQIKTLTFLKGTSSTNISKWQKDTWKTCNFFIKKKQTKN